MSVHLFRPPGCRSGFLAPALHQSEHFVVISHIKGLHLPGRMRVVGRRILPGRRAARCPSKVKLRRFFETNRRPRPIWVAAYRDRPAVSPGCGPVFGPVWVGIWPLAVFLTGLCMLAPFAPVVPGRTIVQDPGPSYRVFKPRSRPLVWVWLSAGLIGRLRHSVEVLYMWAGYGGRVAPVMLPGRSLSPRAVRGSYTRKRTYLAGSVPVHPGWQSHTS